MTQLSDELQVAAYKACNEANLRTVEGLQKLASQLNSLVAAEIQRNSAVTISRPLFLRTSWLADNQRESKVTEFCLEQWESAMPGFIAQHRTAGIVHASFHVNLNSRPTVTFIPAV